MSASLSSFAIRFLSWVLPEIPSKLVKMAGKVTYDHLNDAEAGINDIPETTHDIDWQISPPLYPISSSDPEKDTVTICKPMLCKSTTPQTQCRTNVIDFAHETTTTTTTTTPPAPSTPAHIPFHRSPFAALLPLLFTEIAWLFLLFTSRHKATQFEIPQAVHWLMIHQIVVFVVPRYGWMNRPAVGAVWSMVVAWICAGLCFAGVAFRPGWVWG